MPHHQHTDEGKEDGVVESPAAVDAADASEDSDALTDSDGTEKEPGAPRVRAMSTVRLGALVGVTTVIALAGLSGWLGWRAYQLHEVDTQDQLFVQVARQGAVNLTTIDWAHADADVQRILDSATGNFRDDFSLRSQPFLDVVKKLQSKSIGTIVEAGLESRTGGQAQVLVAVSVKTTMVNQPDPEPRSWRMRISVEKVGNDQAKVSKVSFVP